MWDNISSFMNKKFDSEPVYGGNDKYIKTKTKSYNNDKYLSLTMLDSLIKVN